MFTAEELFCLLIKNQVDFITGIPCSIFKDFLIYINNNSDEINHIAAASEGEAIGIASGYYLATRKVPVIYMQNSGLGNTINPLTSLMDNEVYGIPAILFVSWRGEPGLEDEPQHKKMGKITCELLSTLDIPFEIANENINKLETQFKNLKEKTLKEKKPVALIFKKGLITKENNAKVINNNFTREQAFKILLEKIGKNPIVATTGKTSREIFEIREKNNQSHQTDFLTVGSMGCSSGIALGIALNSDKKIYVIDGDGAVLMKMGTLATIGNCSPKNFVHILIDNSAYESTGGQPTSSPIIDWEKLFLALNYKEAFVVTNGKQLINLDLENIDFPSVIIIKVNQGSRKDLGRPTLVPMQTKENFMKFLKD